MTRGAFLAMVHADDFIRRALVRMINHRVQDFQDPLTSTLVLMATAPLQLVLCESGLLLFKTNLLPVMPYGLLAKQECLDLHRLVEALPNEQLHETIECSGQYTLGVLSMPPPPAAAAASATATAALLLCKQRLLLNFVDLMMLSTAAAAAPHEEEEEPPTAAGAAEHGGSSSSRSATVCGSLCSIVLQRFWSRVCTPSETVSAVMARLSEHMTLAAV